MKTAPLTVVARLGEDFNWWLDATEDAPETPTAGLLDPRQTAYLVEACAEYRAYGFPPELLTSAFHLYAMQAEIEEGRVRLVHNPEARLSDAADLFAVPVLDPEGEGGYGDFLEALEAARVRKLNATHTYARACTTDELRDELDTLDADRYFSDATRHVFEEINEILEWSPAGWDDSSAG
jgi:hypothetical protein